MATLSQNYGPDYSQRRTNDFVANMAYAADAVHGQPTRMQLGEPVATDVDGILDGQSIAAAGNTTTFASAYSHSVMGKYGRNVVVVSDGAATSTVTVTGYDYLGQKIVETLTLNGTTQVVGKKAFKFIEDVAWGLTASRTIDVGWGNGLGVPYCIFKSVFEMVDDAEPSAGTVTVGLAKGTTATATTADPRGLWTPHASFLPDGSRSYVLGAWLRQGQLHGEAHYGG